MKGTDSKPRTLTITGKSITEIMNKRGLSTGALAEAMGKKPLSTVCDRIYQKNISIEKLSELLKPLGYKIMLVPFGTNGEDYYDVG